MPLQTQIRRAIQCTPLTLFTLLTSFACFYAIELTSLPLSIDDEFALTRQNPAVWVSQGRWTIYLIELFVLPKPVLPFVPVAIFGTCLTVAYIIYLNAIDRDPNAAAALVTFPLFAAFPTWSFITDFQANTPAVGIGVLACCIALALLQPTIRSRRTFGVFSLAEVANWALAGLLIAVATGAYQTLPLLFVVLAIGAIAFAVTADPEASVWSILRWLLILATVCAFGLSLYAIVLYGFHGLTGTAVGYIDRIVRMDLLLEQPAMVLTRAFQFAWTVYSGSSVIYVVTAWSFSIVITFSFLAIALTPQLKNRASVRGVLIVLHASMLLVPFTMAPVSGGQIPVRSLMGVPSAVWISAYLTITTPVAWLGRASFAAAAIAVFQSLYTVYLYQTNSILVRVRDAATAAAIYQRIAEQQPNWDRSRTYPVLVYGAWPFDARYQRIWSSMAGASFFEWDGGNPARVVTFMRLLGYHNIAAAPDRTRREFLEVAREMPVWPASGSVRTHGEFTLVKLGPVK